MCDKGRLNENRIADAFYGIRNGRSNLFPDWLIGVERTKHYSIEDLKGKDFIFTVQTKDGIRAIPIQVKSSKKSAMRFLRIGAMTGRRILVIIVENNDTEEELRSRVITMISEEVFNTKRNSQPKKRIKRHERTRMQYHQCCHA